MYKNNIKRVYVPSTFKKDTKVICVSNAKILEALKCADMEVKYDEEISS